ncbi:MAG: hypothetical protein OEY23_13005 [Acidimicrobiia bacterium]|nr:hypothetical protein [Acidimicrobiia bacterium]
MTKHVLLVFTDPVEGKEDEYNRWYNDVHLGEVLQTPGFVRAQRFKVADLMPGVTDHTYVAIYELETDDPGAAMKALQGGAGTMTMSDAIDLKSAKMSLASEVSALVSA